MNEYLDVLTEKGDYTNDKELREVCHEKGLWHKAVALLIVNSENKVLLQKRSKSKKMWPGMWDISAGRPCIVWRIWIRSCYKRNKRGIGN